MELLMGRWVGGQNRFWIGLGYRLAPRECFSRHAVQEEVSQAEPVPVQPQTIPIRRIFLKGKGHVSMPFFRFYAGRNKRNKLTTCSKGQGGRFGPPEGYERQAEQSGAEQQQG